MTRYRAICTDGDRFTGDLETVLADVKEHFSMLEHLQPEHDNAVYIERVSDP